MMAQQQVLKDQILAWAHCGVHDCDEQPEDVKHGVRIADAHSFGVFPPHTRWSGWKKVAL